MKDCSSLLHDDVCYRSDIKCSMFWMQFMLYDSCAWEWWFSSSIPLLLGSFEEAFSRASVICMTDFAFHASHTRRSSCVTPNHYIGGIWVSCHGTCQSQYCLRGTFQSKYCRHLLAISFPPLKGVIYVQIWQMSNLA